MKLCCRISFHRENQSKQDRIRYAYGMKDGRGINRTLKTTQFKHNVTWGSEASHIAASRPFVEYLLHSEVGKVSIIIYLKKHYGQVTHSNFEPATVTKIACVLGQDTIIFVARH